jgi:hypothetical protein
MQLKLLPEQPLRPPPGRPAGQHEQRDHPQRDQAELPRQPEHRRQHQDQVQQHRQRVGHQHPDHPLCLVDVTVNARDQRPGLRPGEKRQRLPQQMPEHARPQLQHQALADPLRIPRLHVSRARVDQGQPRDGQRQRDDHALPVPQDAVVDDQPQDQRAHHHDGRIHRRYDRQQHHRTAVPPQVRPDPPHRPRPHLLPAHFILAVPKPELRTRDHAVHYPPDPISNSKPFSCCGIQGDPLAGARIRGFSRPGGPTPTRARVPGPGGRYRPDHPGSSRGRWRP